jgi:hypothetical protein
MNLSAVVVTYRRLASIERILAAWLAETRDVWLCDCSAEGVRTALPINIIRAVPDPGNRIRHAVALLTAGEWVVKADDDVLPRPGIGNDFVNYQRTLGPAILGIHGRKFIGNEYYSQTRLYGSKEISVVEEVDFVGVMTCAARSLLPFDLRGCGSAVEDLFWQMGPARRARKFVIPTANFQHLAESKDSGRLCGTPEQKQARADYYRIMFNKNYK